MSTPSAAPPPVAGLEDPGPVASDPVRAAPPRGPGAPLAGPVPRLFAPGRAPGHLHAVAAAT
ncbi:hypothetical protein AB0E83_15250 [Streptomyces sp. NPDC035033]|uniref:hypothetical protein n=1 Tax=Streptomyces sp. NPDC035033 TaxID=3155368 RepID=UPI0033EC78DD